LELVADLGHEWEAATASLASALPEATVASPAAVASPESPRGLPLPLGAIVASRALPPEVIKTVEELIRLSIEYAFAHPHASREFVKEHAQEMDDAVIDSHIALFVNDNSLSLSLQARAAIKELTGVPA
jgi:1,4-dihydroxy-6-naphthoate synthase